MIMLERRHAREDVLRRVDDHPRVHPIVTSDREKGLTAAETYLMGTLDRGNGGRDFQGIRVGLEELGASRRDRQDRSQVSPIREF